jgi:predicted nucleotidyltransferase
MKELTENILQEMVGIIVRIANPEQVVLFGSRARDAAGPHSDIDFLIVGSGKSVKGTDELALLGNLWNVLRKFRFPIDLLLFSQDDVARWKDSRFHVIGTALREGRIVYERH